MLAGGLIAIGIFIMQWTTHESLDRFEVLARKTFRPKEAPLYLLGRVRRLIVLYLQDGQYSSDAIEQSYQSAFGQGISLFNPLYTDIKVAVTTTSARDTEACLFSNYNGERRPRELGK